MKLHRVLFSGLAFSMSILLGIYSAFSPVATGSRMASTIASGDWWTYETVGSVDADARTRAYTARVGLLALAPEETTYYHLFDVDGEPISSDFVYRLRGKQIPGRWWSITVYGEDHLLVSNEENKYSIKSTELERNEDGSFVIFLSRDKRDGNWVSLGDGQHLSLSLRMYNPPADIRQKLDKLELPTIEKLGAAL